MMPALTPKMPDGQDLLNSQAKAEGRTLTVEYTETVGPNKGKKTSITGKVALLKEGEKVTRLTVIGDTKKVEFEVHAEDTDCLAVRGKKVTDVKMTLAAVVDLAPKPMIGPGGLPVIPVLPATTEITATNTAAKGKDAVWVLRYGAPGDPNKQEFTVPVLPGIQGPIEDVKLLGTPEKPMYIKVDDKVIKAVLIVVTDKKTGVVRKTDTATDGTPFTGYLEIDDRGLVVSGKVGRTNVPPDAAYAVALAFPPEGKLNDRRAVPLPPEKPPAKEPPVAEDLLKKPRVEPPFYTIAWGKGDDQRFAVLQPDDVKDGRIRQIVVPTFKTPGRTVDNQRTVTNAAEMETLLTDAERKLADAAGVAGSPARTKYLEALAARTKVAVWEIHGQKADMTTPPGKTVDTKETLLLRFDDKGEPLFFTYKGGKIDLKTATATYLATKDHRPPAGWIGYKDSLDPGLVADARYQMTRREWDATVPAYVKKMLEQVKTAGPGYGYVYIAPAIGLNPGAVYGIDRTTAAWTSMKWDACVDLRPEAVAKLKAPPHNFSDAEVDHLRENGGKVSTFIKLVRNHNNCTEAVAIEKAKAFIAEFATGPVVVAQAKWPKIDPAELLACGGDRALLTKLVAKAQGINEADAKVEVDKFAVDQASASLRQVFPAGGNLLYGIAPTSKLRVDLVALVKTKGIAAPEGDVDNFLQKHVYASEADFRAAVVKQWPTITADEASKLPAPKSKLHEVRAALVAAKAPDGPELDAFIADHMLDPKFLEKARAKFPTLDKTAVIKSPLDTMAELVAQGNPQTGATQLKDLMVAANVRALAVPKGVAIYAEPMKEAEAFFAKHGTSPTFMDELKKLKDLPPAEVAKIVPPIDFARKQILDSLAYDFVSRSASTLPPELLGALTALPLPDMVTPNTYAAADIAAAKVANAAQFRPQYVDHDGKRGYIFARTPADLSNGRGAFFFDRDGLPEAISYAYDKALDPAKTPSLIGVAQYLDPKEVKPETIQLLRDKYPDLRAAKEIWFVVQNDGSVVFIPAANDSVAPAKPGEIRAPLGLDHTKARIYDPFDFAVALRSMNENPDLWKEKYPDVKSVTTAPLGTRPTAQVTLKEAWPTILDKWNGEMLRATELKDGVYTPKAR